MTMLFLIGILVTSTQICVMIQIAYVSTTFGMSLSSMLFDTLIVSNIISIGLLLKRSHSKYFSYAVSYIQARSTVLSTLTLLVYAIVFCFRHTVSELSSKLALPDYECNYKSNLFALSLVTYSSLVLNLSLSSVLLFYLSQRMSPIGNGPPVSLNQNGIENRDTLFAPRMIKTTSTFDVDNSKKKAHAYYFGEANSHLAVENHGQTLSQVINIETGEEYVDSSDTVRGHRAAVSMQAPPPRASVLLNTRSFDSFFKGI